MARLALQGVIALSLWLLSPSILMADRGLDLGDGDLLRAKGKYTSNKRLVRLPIRIAYRPIFWCHRKVMLPVSGSLARSCWHSQASGRASVRLRSSEPLITSETGSSWWQLEPLLAHRVWPFRGQAHLGVAETENPDA